MKQLVSIFFFVFLLLNDITAKIWTVDNTGKAANFSNILAAITAASDGDTLLMGGGGAAYSDINLAKKLCIIGTGYFLNENPNTVENKGQVSVANVTFSSGSAGSVLVGITSSTLITVSTDGITIRRCFISRITINGNNNLIKQNYCSWTTNIGSIVYTITINGTNNTIRNNYIYCRYYTSTTYYENAINCGGSNIIENNIINSTTGISSSSINSSSFGNNILISGSISFINCNPYNNIGNDAQFGTSNGNQSYVNMGTVFVSGTTDGKWQLSATSPAKGAGLGGVDCGMYGGTDPYVLSGIADIPVITSIVVPGRANPSNGLNVQINAKSNK